jgi:hypothetical protein
VLPNGYAPPWRCPTSRLLVRRPPVTFGQQEVGHVDAGLLGSVRSSHRVVAACTGSPPEPPGPHASRHELLADFQRLPPLLALHPVRRPAVRGQRSGLHTAPRAARAVDAGRRVRVLGTPARCRR